MGGADGEPINVFSTSGGGADGTHGVTGPAGAADVVTGAADAADALDVLEVSVFFAIPPDATVVTFLSNKPGSGIL